MRETKVEKHLKAAVKKAGGLTRKWVSPGRRGVPDQIVIWPNKSGAQIHFVETKAPGKGAADHQAREHARLWAMQCVVLVLDTIEKVDRYVVERE